MKFLRFIKNLWVDAVWRRVTDINIEDMKDELLAWLTVIVVSTVMIGVIYGTGRAIIATGMPSTLGMSPPDDSTPYPLLVGFLVVALLFLAAAVLTSVKRAISYCWKIWKRS